jgi:hypothetical protein
MRRYVSALILTVALASPLAIRADDRHDNDHHRYWDASKHDWHEWSEREDRAYHRYLEDQHRQYRDWAKANKRQQREYWKWRHNHSDDTLFQDRR